MTLRIVIGSSRLVVRPIEITGLAELVSVYPDLESAIHPQQPAADH